MFEKYTFQNLLNDALDNAPEEIDTREGSIFYDAVAGAMLKIAKFYADLEMIAEFVYIDTTSGEYLDRKAGEHALTRLPATPAKYYFSYTGMEPDVGERFYTNGLYFVLKKTEDDILYLEAEVAGAAGNSVYNGTAAIPVNNLQYLESATFGLLKEAGTDIETDSALRVRLQEKIAGPAENGNKQHYRTWCESVEGVGRARIIPLWNGPNTVKGIIIAPDGTAAGEDVIARVQQYIDPDDDNDGEGDGLGEGVSNIGAHFTAVAPTETEINISFSATLAASATAADVKAEVEAAVTARLKNLTMNAEDDENIIVLYSKIGADIIAVDGIEDYSSLTLNNDTENITLSIGYVPVLGEVTINVSE